MRILFLVLAILSIAVQAQTTLINFNYLGFEPTCNPFEDDPYNFYYPAGEVKVSHGTPSAGDVYNDNFYDGAVLGASFDLHSTEKTEGLFINYDFKSTNSYTLTFTLAHYSGDQVGISIYASRGVKNDAGDYCNLDVTPLVPSKDEIYSDIKVYDGPHGFFEGITPPTFFPDADYSQLWIHSTQYFLNQTGSFILSEVLIQDNGPVDNGSDDGSDDDDIDPQDRPEKPENLRIADVDANYLRLEWDKSIVYNGADVSGYRIYIGTEYYSTYDVKNNLYHHIPFDCSTGSYSYSVKAYNSQGMHSPRSELIYIDVGENITQDKDESLKHDLVLIASNSITLKPGFRYKTPSSGGEFWGKIFSCENSSSSREFTAFNVEKDYDSIQSNRKVASTIIKLEKKISEDQLLSISPNPTKGMFNITIDFENEKENVNVYVYNVYGKVVAEKMYNKVHTLQTEFDMSEMQRGLYMIHIVSEGSHISRKVILH